MLQGQCLQRKHTTLKNPNDALAKNKRLSVEKRPELMYKLKSCDETTKIKKRLDGNLTLKKRMISYAHLSTHT